MANSIAQSARLTCPQCQAAFDAEIWLIIDADERPDLLGRARDGSLHQATCPNNHSSMLDAPLLIYRPRQRPPLIFSPAQQTNEEQDREQASGLLALLRQSLSRAWQDSWLQEAEAVPRSQLAAALADGEEMGSNPGPQATHAADSVADLAAILQELSRPARLADMARRINLCWQALALASRAQHPELWAALQNELGNNLAQNPLGERAENIEQAIAAYQRALEVRTRAAYPEDWAMTQNNLATAYRNRIRGERAENIEQAIRRWEELWVWVQQTLAGGSVSGKLGQQRRWSGFYAQLTEAYLEQATTTSSQSPRARCRALEVAESSKSRLTAHLAGRAYLPAPVGASPTDVAREQPLAAEWHSIDASDLLQSTLGVEAHDRARAGYLALLQRRADVLNELRPLWDRIASSGMAGQTYVALRRGDPLAWQDLSRLASQCGTKTGLLSLLLASGQAVLFFWRHGLAAPAAFSVPLDSNDLSRLYLSNYEDEVLNRSRWRSLGRPLSQRWRALGRVLFEPLLPHLAGLDHLVISPESSFHVLPLHALQLGDGSTLLDHLSVSYVPCFAVAARLLGRPLVGSDVRSLALGYTPAPTGSAEQRWFHGEAQAVAATLGTAPLLGPQATSAAITAQAGQALKYVHLSCHGLFNPGDPMASAVLLADGPFSVRQWSALALDADLVTLSACQTGLLGSLGGDEWSGFSQGLLLAGARSSVLGLWSVDALTTAVLMNDFYRRLEAGQPKAAALRAACLALRDGKLMPVSPHLDVSDPYYWAPFALYGQWQ